MFVVLIYGQSGHQENVTRQGSQPHIPHSSFTPLLSTSPPTLSLDVVRLLALNLLLALEERLLLELDFVVQLALDGGLSLAHGRFQLVTEAMLNMHAIENERCHDPPLGSEVLVNHREHAVLEFEHAVREDATID